MATGQRSLVANLGLAFAISLPIANMMACIYVAAEGRFSFSVLNSFDQIEFLRHSPIMTGRVSDLWLDGLAWFGGTIAVFLLATLFFHFNKSRDHNGTAQWGDFGTMAKLGYLQSYERITGAVFGKAGKPGSNAKYLTNHDMPHSMVVAPTRAGKGVGVVIPTLLTFDGSVVALDVKGELFDMTSRARLARGDRVFKFSPLDRAGRTHCYNPVLDIVSAPAERQFLEARRLAANLITAKGKGSEGFIDGARDLFVAGILACIERGTPTIGAVYDLFALPGEKYKLFAQLAEECKNPEAQRIFDNMASNDTKIITSYTSVLGDGGLNLWADGLIKQATSRSDFSIYNLRRDPTSIFIVVSPNDLEVLAPLVRLFFQQLTSILQREMPAKDETFEVLFLLDEFKHLGKLQAIETAITTIAGYKARFMFIIQSLSALTANYEAAGKENFLGNCGVQVFMATADDETPQYISKAIGDYTYKSVSKSWSVKDPFNTNTQTSKQGATLIRPEQIRLLDDDTQIVLVKGRPPMMMPKVKYYADRHLKKIFESQTGPLPEPEALHVPPPAAFTPAHKPEQEPEAHAAPVVEQAESQPYSPDFFEVQSSVPISQMLDDAILGSGALMSSEPDEPEVVEVEVEEAPVAAKPKRQPKPKAPAKAAPAPAQLRTDAQQALLDKIIALQSKAKGFDKKSGQFFGGV